MESLKPILESLAFPVAFLLVAVAVSYALWGLRKGIEAFERKLGVDLSAETEGAIEAGVERLVLAAEEMAARRLKLDANDRMKGAEKARWVHDQVSRMWPDLIPDDIDARIDAALAQIQGMGATGDSVGRELTED
jgi:hypothetical protein|tara:strand:- start:11126 stop:11530 length:405 start_codon:yes stop_codon:yes gene_type:complete